MAVLLVASIISIASAKSFLQAELGIASIKNTLLSEISGMADIERLSHIQDELGSMYRALPKNEHGRLDPPSVRYALHRYFMHKHGWFVNGLGPAHNSTSTSNSTIIMKDRAPAYIQSLFEHRLHGSGLDHHDLAVFTATMSDLIHHEVAGVLETVYAALELPTVGPVTENEYDLATKSYLLTYLSGGIKFVENQGFVTSTEEAWSEDYPAWDSTKVWARDMSQTFDLSRRDLLNPFKRERRSFEKHISYLQEMGHRLGTFQNLECHKLKDQLVDMEDAGTGRVPLSRFYRGGLDGDWTFTESVEYLRHVGALDETDPERMSVVIPNYLLSPANCLAGSSFYSVCCSDGCEELMGQVESQVAGSSASPQYIAAVVSEIHSDTVHAPRNLSAGLRMRLGDIGKLHDGLVPLHGRLFAQWMHHAFPRECPYPHAIGAVNRMTPSEWMDLMDIDSAEASEAEMSLLVTRSVASIMTPEDKAEALPWTAAEELVAGHKQMSHNLNSWSPTLRLAAVACVLASLAVSLFRIPQVSAPGSQSKPTTSFV